MQDVDSWWKEEEVIDKDSWWKDDRKKSKGAWFGAQYLEEGDYNIRGGLGNQVLADIKVKDGNVYIKLENDKFTKAEVPTLDEFKSEFNNDKKKKSLLDKIKSIFKGE